MIFDSSLKDKIQPLSEEYYKNKDIYSESRLMRLEEKVISLIENYVFSYCIKCTNPEDIEDYKQSARLGIISALRTYNPDKGAFCTWVIWHSRNNVIRNRSQESIKIPNYVKEKIRKIRFFEHEFNKSNNRLPTLEEILSGTLITISDYNKTKFFEDLIVEKIDGDNNREQINSLNFNKENNSNLNMFHIDLLRELNSFEKNHREIFYEYYLEDIPVNEISKKYKIKSNNVYIILNNIKKQLKNKLSDIY